MLVDHLRLTALQEQKNNKKIQKKQGDKIFSVNTEDTKQPSADSADNTQHVNTVQQTNPFLAIQEFDDLLENKERLQKHGKNMLAKLKNIRLALLNDEIYIDEIKVIREYLSAENFQFNYPEYQQVIDDILLRAEVEIAKYERDNEKEMVGDDRLELPTTSV